MERNESLVQKGRNVSLAALLQQGQYSHGLAIKFATEVARRGFGKLEAEALESKLALLASESVARLENRAESKAHRVAEAKAVADAKTFKRELDSALTDLYARERFENDFRMPVAEEVFRVRTPRGLGNSTPKIVEYLMNVRPYVEKVKALLAPYFDGADAVAKLDEALTELKAADTAQELSRAGLSNETLDIYQLKGEVLFLIERLNRAGRTAFDGDAAKASQFNKDILLRARRRGVEVVDGASAEAGS